MSTTSTFAIYGRRVDEARLAEVCGRYGVAELSVFGSAARGEITTASDVMSRCPCPGRQARLRHHRLEDDLSERSGRAVDLVAKKALHRLLRDEATAQACILYAACRLLLAEIIDATERIVALTVGRSADEIDADRDCRDALLWNYTVLGEAVSQLSETTKAAHPDVPGAIRCG